ncbi:hypothetical protein HAX54_041582 [Datura stramonium]|uniref:Uncharacterized protein n=1 Tax=Datura stramonium TaxID=4076 RepID=A0ABS8SL51_DATST|nr:hypothetical protein [Datura stramonium]
METTSLHALAHEVLKEQDIVFANRDVPAAGREAAYGGTDIVYGPKWCTLRKEGLPVNIGEQIFLAVLNVITGMLWGGTVKGEERASLGAEFRHVITATTELLGTPNVSDFYPGLAWFDLQGVTKKMKVLAKRFDKIFVSMIDQRQKLDRNGGTGTGVGQESKDFCKFC